MMCYERLLTNTVSRMRASRRHFLDDNTKLAKLPLNLVPRSTAKYTVLKRRIGIQQAPASIPREVLHPWKGGPTQVRHQRRQTARGFKVTASIATWTVGHMSRLPQRPSSFQAGLGMMERSTKWRTEGYVMETSLRLLLIGRISRLWQLGN